MPGISVPHIALLTLGAIAGIVLGWLVRGRRAAHEKDAINAGWREQLDARRSEHRRLNEQNLGLAEQVSQCQASRKDAVNRARELSAALKEAFRRRDELQRQIKDIRSNLESALAERRRLQSDVRHLTDSDNSLLAAIKQKDEKIFRLSRDLESWQDRLPPLIQRFKDRDDDARRLESALDRANERIFELESGRAAGHTHVESVRRDLLSDELRASNDGIGGGTGTFPAVGAGRTGAAPARVASGHGPVDGARDDLQAIKGVGPAIEKTLHELGIFRFTQIAELSEVDINRIAERLRGFRSRIYREDWIGQARELQYLRDRPRHPG